MDNFVLIGAGVVVAIGLLAAFLSYAVYGGVHGSLNSAKVGEVYNFTYEQPLHGEPERYLARVLDVHTLDDASIRRLNVRSRYRANDPQFQRTRHLVTCQTPDGTVRNFYAERTRNCRKPLFAGLLFSKATAAAL